MSRSASSRSKKPTPQPRRLAFDAIRAVSDRDAYANLVLPSFLKDAKLGQRDAALATELTYGTLRTCGTLDAILESAAGRKLNQLDTPVVDVLRLGAYQLLYTRIKDHAAVATTVSLAKSRISPRISGLVNAVLRKVAQRDLNDWVDHLAAGDSHAALVLREAHPAWIIEALSEVLPPETDLAASLHANNRAPQVHLCARPNQMSRDDLVSQTGGQPGPLSPYAVHLPSGDPGKVAAVAAGAAHVQDEGSQWAALSLANTALDGPDKTWVDLCAGPGGKAALLGSIAEQRDAHLDAVEITEHRAQLVQSSTTGLPVTTHHTDGRQFQPAHPADRTLIDAPCSGLGALRRRPEARWRKQPSDIDDLTTTQKELLTAGIGLTRAGGVIAYVTCSPVKAETRDIVNQALTEQPVELIDQPRQLWPHLDGTDAMFVALLRKTS